MVHLAAFFGLLISASTVIAAPTDISRSNLGKRAVCTFTTAAQAIAGKTGCATIILDSISVPAGITLDLTGLASGTNVIFQGRTTFGHEAWSGPLISVSGQDITVTGEAGHVLDGQGGLYWDGQGTNDQNTNPKPGFFAAHGLTGSSSINNLNVLNSPVQVFSIDGSNGLSLIDIHIDDSAGNAGSLAHNTDGFDIGNSHNIYISGANVQNQDDCLAINSGTNITFTGGYCSGGHGLSIGSVGGRSDNTVEDINILSSIVSNSRYGVRIKTVSGATGLVSGVTYEDITLNGIAEYGVNIEQNYLNSEPTGPPTSGVPITGLTINNVHGTMTGGNPILISCAACTGWTWEGVAITGGTRSEVCVGVPSVVGSC